MLSNISTSKITAKEQVAFSPRYHSRIEQIVRAGRDVSALSSIAPAFLNVDVTWRCNYDCKGCIDGGVVGREKVVSGGKLDMPWNMAEDLLDYARKEKLIGFIIQGGEPLLYPRIDDFLFKSAEQSFALRLVTNGSCIAEHVDPLSSVFGRETASFLRVSINADQDHYPLFTGNPTASLTTVLNGMEMLATNGARVNVSTVFFNEACGKNGMFSNSDQIRNIVEAAEKAGASSLKILPGRDPNSKASAPLSGKEQDMLEELEGRDGPMKIVLARRFEMERTAPACKQNKDFWICPTGLLRTLVGSDGTLYNCTDHRGEPEAAIGQINPPQKPFSAVWHSIKRVQRQRTFSPAHSCKDITCDRYGVNTTLSLATEGYHRYQSTSALAHILNQLDIQVDPFI